MGFSKEVFAANLRAARAALRMSQKELADAVGVSSNTIVEYESDNGYTPGADKIVALARALRKSPNELMGWKEV